MTIKVKISSDRTLDIKNRRFGGIQGDIGSVDLDFDISDIEEQEQIWRVEFKGCAGTFESTVPLTPSENHIVVTIPTSITDVGGTAQVYLIEEQITNGEIVKRVCSYPLRLYFYNKSNEKTDVSISEYGRNVTEMYLFVANKASEIEKIKAEIEEEAHSASSAYTQAVEAIEGKENEVVGGNAITVDRETAEGKTIIGVDNSQVIGRDEFNHSIKPAIYEDIEKKADEEYVESIPSMIVETRFNQPKGNPIQFETSSDGTSYLTLDVDYELSADSDNAVANYVLKENLENKQDKEDGKGLSTNDYTTADKNKLASVESGANKTVVDNEISEESENPVQNKVLYSILCDKTDKEYVDNYAEKKMGTSTVLNNPLTANCNYFFTVDDNFILSFPTEDLTRGDTIYLNFECLTDVTLIVDTSNTTAIDIIPEANKGYEVFGCWNGNKWVLGYDEYDLPVTTTE